MFVDGLSVKTGVKSNPKMKLYIDEITQNKQEQTSVFRKKGTILQVFAYFSVAMFKILGLAPWKVNLVDVNRNILLTKSRWGSAYNIFLIIVICSCNIYVLPTMYELKKSMTRIEASVQICTIILENMCLISTWSLFFFRQELIVIAYKKLCNVDAILCNCADYSLQINYRIPTIFFINILFTMASVIFGFCFYEYVYVVSWSIPTVINAWVLIQYSLILETTQQRFKSINKTMLRIGNASKNSMLGSLFLSRFPIDESVSSQIINMKYAFNELSNACIKVIDFFALPCLLCIIYFAGTTTIFLYFIVSGFVKNGWDHNVFMLISDNVWSFVPTFSILTLSASVNNIIKEIKRTNKNIHYLMDLSTTEKVNEELLEFSRDLLHQKIEFTTYKIIILDGSLLYSLPGKIITYLVILIQFHLLSCS